MRKFKKIYVEITNICNMSCSFCPKTKRKQEFMRLELFERILSEVKGFGKFIYFHVMGEPLLHPELKELLGLCEKHDFKVNITTNGTLIEKVSDILLSGAALRQINFSLHSFEANEISCSMKEYLDRIFDFVNTASKKGVFISFRLWNLSDKGKNQENSYIINRIEDEYCSGAKIEDIEKCGSGLKLVENVYLNQAKKFDWPSMDLKEISDKGFCYGLRDQVGFLVNGTVIPCCLDGEANIALGNICEDNFANIINGKRSIDLYEGFSRREVVEELCRKCGYRERFG